VASALFILVSRRRASWRTCRGYKRIFAQQAGQDGAAEVGDLLEDFAGGLKDNDFLTVHESQYGVWGVLDKLDEVGVDDQRLIVESCELNHRKHQTCAQAFPAFV